jgi:hypothetical protein
LFRRTRFYIRRAGLQIAPARVFVSCANIEQIDSQRFNHATVTSLVHAARLKYPCVTRSVKKIQAEIAKLTPAEVRQISKWLAEYEAQL